MFKKLIIALNYLILLSTISAHEIATDSLIIMDTEKESSIKLGWNYAGTSNIDYQKIIDDEAYALFFNDIHCRPQALSNCKAKNYLTDEDGNILFSLQILDLTHLSDLLTKSKAWDFANKSYSILESNESESAVYLTYLNEQSTGIHVFKRQQDESGKLSLQLIEGVDLKTATELYKEYLSKNISQADSAPLDELFFNFKILELLPKDLANKHKADYAFTVEYYAKRKNNLDSFHHKGKKVFGVKKTTITDTKIFPLNIEGYP